MIKTLVFLSCVVGQCVLWASPELIQKNSRPLQAESNLDALDPWETPMNAFFIRTHHGVPTVSDEWQIEIDGLVGKPMRLSLKDLKEYPQKSFHAVLECSGNGRALHFPKVSGIQWEKGAMGNAEWTGVALAEILKKLEIKPEAKFARIEGADLPAMASVPPFYRSIPLEKLLATDTLLALKMNREDLPVLHGGPVRLILPNWYGQNWIKWVRKITLMETEDSGFFMKKGYRMPKSPVKPGEKWDSATGVPVTAIRVQSFILHPRAGEKVSPGVVKIQGKAFSGSGTISKVELSLDQGKHWHSAQVEPPHSDGGWQEFEAGLEIKKPGKKVVMARATDSSGNIQPLVADWNPSGYLWNAIDKVSFEVSKKVLPPFTGEKIAEEKCLTCHAQQLLDSQALTAPGWEKVLSKMETFGVKLTASEKQELLEYFSKRQTTSSTPEKVNFDVQNRRFEIRGRIVGNAESGQELFQKQCASCHGEKGEGKLGPALKGRMVPEDYFQQVVLKGLRTMPSFEDSLSKEQLVDLREFLVN